MGFWKSLGEAFEMSNPTFASIKAESAMARTEEAFRARERVDPVFRQQRELNRIETRARKERNRQRVKKGAKVLGGFAAGYVGGDIIDTIRGK